MCHVRCLQSVNVSFLCRPSRRARSAYRNGNKSIRLFLLLFTVFVIVYHREQFHADYEALQARLHTLPDQLTHDVMVRNW